MLSSNKTKNVNQKLLLIAARISNDIKSKQRRSLHKHTSDKSEKGVFQRKKKDSTQQNTVVLASLVRMIPNDAVY